MATRNNKPETQQDVSDAVDLHFAKDGAEVLTPADPNALAALTDDVMREIGGTGNAFNDAMEIARQIHGNVKSLTDEFGNGFQLLDNKGLLVGERFVFLKWQFSEGKFGTYVTASVVTEKGGKYILVDGSSGIREQLHTYTRKQGRWGGFVADHGLRVSSYSTCEACGQPRSSFDDVCTNQLSNGSQCGDASTNRSTGETYYLDLTA
jgi:hypothetical protein